MDRVNYLDIFGVQARQLPCVTGEGSPTAETDGAVGDFYLDTTTGESYVCTAQGVWKKISSAEQLDVLSEALENHTHTATDVGAAEAEHTHEEYAASDHTHTPADIGAAASDHTHSNYAASSHDQAASTITAGTLSGQVVANATAVATLTNKQVRNIYAGTSSMTDGSTALTTGDLYVQY